jgi:hypothetical protein
MSQWLADRLNEISQRCYDLGDWIEDWADHFDLRLHAALREGLADVEAGRTLPIDLLWADDGFGNIASPCVVCGSKMQVVRPGKFQCPKCE